MTTTTKKSSASPSSTIIISGASCEWPFDVTAEQDAELHRRWRAAAIARIETDYPSATVEMDVDARCKQRRSHSQEIRVSDEAMVDVDRVRQLLSAACQAIVEEEGR